MVHDVRAFYFNTRGSSLPPERSLYVRTMILESLEVYLILVFSPSLVHIWLKSSTVDCQKDPACLSVCLKHAAP